MSEAIKQIGRLHEIQKEKEKLEQEILTQLEPLKAKLELLKEEEVKIREDLTLEGLKNGEKKNSNGKQVSTLSYSGLGTVTVTEKEEYDVIDVELARSIVREDTAYLDAQKIDVDKKQFVKIALDIKDKTGDLISCVDKVKKTSTRITLPKIEEEDPFVEETA